VARFIGVCYEQERGEYIARLVSMFYERGTLKDNLGYIQNDQQRVRLVCIYFIQSRAYLMVYEQLRQFFSGLEYLHRKNVIHGDLKPVSTKFLFAGTATYIHCRRTFSLTTLIMQF
jgi:serine/threonine protein kinase